MEGWDVGRFGGCRGPPSCSLRSVEKWERELETVPFFDGLLAGEFDALVGSFAGEPELHHPVRGRIRGTRAFEAYVTETNEWLRQRKVSVENVEYGVVERRGFVEVVPEKIAITIDGEKLGPARGQSVISHGPDRNLSVDEIGIQLVEDAAGAEA